MGNKRKSTNRDEEIRKKIRRLESKLLKKSRRRIRVLESSSSDNEDNAAIDCTNDNAPGVPHIDQTGRHSTYQEYPLSPLMRPCSPRDALSLSVVASAQPEQERFRSASPQPGPSSASDPPLGQTDTTLSEDKELDEEILNLLGDAPRLNTVLGKSIHKDIASRWHEILTKGLQKDVKDKLFQEYLIPSNCELLCAPILNPEAKAALPDVLIRRDASLMQRQKQIGHAVSALGQATELIIKHIPSPQKFLRPISDASRILCDSHFTETKTRRNFVISAINTELKDTLINTERDSFLFGDNVTDKLRVAQSIQKSGNTLKNTPKPAFNQFNKQNFAFKNRNQKGNLNFKALHQRSSTANQNKPDAGRQRPAQPRYRQNFQYRATDRPRSPPRRSYKR